MAIEARKSRHREKFLLDHPELKEVSGSEYQDLLLWANEEKFITLTEFEEELFYSEFDLGAAKMWHEKTERRA